MDNLTGKYILKGKKPIPEPDVLKWGKWFETSQEDRIVKQQTLKNGNWVSTVFLGLDHNFSGIGKPILFETMVFSSKELGEGSDDTNRYETWEEAEKGHKTMVKKHS